ncbi:MAG: DEAD/DEAH box helicase family protein [Turicibacter sp.]|nr:DEAD/DEAH box helicase family protein [Turicibacter sp.]
MDIYGREWLEGEFQEILQTGILTSDDVVRVKGVDGQCNRCFNVDPTRFGSYNSDGETVRYCRVCLEFGRVCERTFLYRSQKPLEIGGQAGTLDVDFSLSPLQKKASAFAQKTFLDQSAGMVWAVCGAGKTEMMFETIALALNSGKRVCWAIPRTDVVIELLPRLQKAFPKASVVGLFGNSKQKRDYGDIVVTTVHQLIRFHHAFGLMIIDEVDAFPYTFDEMLPRVALKACRMDCATIYLSATPTAKDQLAIKRGGLPCCKIPARFHLKPLDVPKFYWLGNFKKKLQKNQLPNPLKKWLKGKLADERRALLFVPTIASGQKLQGILEKELGEPVKFVFSSDPLRAEKVKAYKEGEGQFLMTTMILERGVTIPDIDVAVIDAGNAVYEESALVQISGRVGRSPKFPSGEIAFFHYGRTLAMESARDQIQGMNHQAMKEGILCLA